jgi:hypothetical protein
MTIDYGDIFGENIACKETNVTFIIVGDEIVPAEITEHIGIQPTRAFSKGEEYEVKRVGLIRYRPVGHWSISSEGLLASTSTEVHAKWLLDKLESKIDKIEKYKNDPKIRTSLVFWWEAFEEHGGFTLSSDTLGRLCRLCNDIDFVFIG